ncbi:hypothetical protein KY284_034465 [Solanum tuberosum]|nr:hypothetical protein KY284_034465 [Solanum tuberosum]
MESILGFPMQSGSVLRPYGRKQLYQRDLERPQSGYSQFSSIHGSSPPVHSNKRGSSPPLSIIALVQVLAVFSRGSSPPLITAWFKSIATLTLIQVLGHIYVWFKSTIILSLGLSPMLLQILVQVLDPPSSIQLKSLTPISSG